MILIQLSEESTTRIDTEDFNFGYASPIIPMETTILEAVFGNVSDGIITLNGAQYSVQGITVYYGASGNEYFTVDGSTAMTYTFANLATSIESFATDSVSDVFTGGELRIYFTLQAV